MLTILNALLIACAKSSIGSMQVGFLMALANSCSKILDIGREQWSLVLVDGLREKTRKSYPRKKHSKLV
jgi:hypothetical protein